MHNQEFRFGDVNFEGNINYEISTNILGKC